LLIDSTTLRTDTVLRQEIFTKIFTTATQSAASLLRWIVFQPKYKGYDFIAGLYKGFSRKASFVPYTYLVYPYKDSVAFFKLLEKRLRELERFTPNVVSLDTFAFSKKFSEESKRSMS